MLARIDGHVFSACTISSRFTFLCCRLLQQVLRSGLGVRSPAQNEIIVIDGPGTAASHPRFCLETGRETALGECPR